MTYEQAIRAEALKAAATFRVGRDLVPMEEAVLKLADRWAYWIQWGLEKPE